MRGTFTDPGGDLFKLKAAAAQQGVTIEKILLTHGHIDHCGSAGILAKELGVPIEGPHEADRFWISRLDDDGKRWLLPYLRWGRRGREWEVPVERRVPLVFSSSSRESRADSNEREGSIPRAVYRRV